MGIDRARDWIRSPINTAPSTTLVLRGDVFEGIQQHVRGKNPEVRGTTAVDTDGVIARTAIANVQITRMDPTRLDESGKSQPDRSKPDESPIMIRIGVGNSIRYILDVEPDGTVSRTLGRSFRTTAVSQKPQWNNHNIRADFALKLLQQVALGFQPLDDNSVESADAPEEMEAAA